MASSESWRDCVGWLERCQVVPYDHPLTRGDDARFVDLACYLRDGVVLCHLINRLHPNAINTKLFSQRPQHSQYLCKKNFRVFCDACRRVFGVSESDMFRPEELFDLEDFEKVVYTLAKLSQTELARKSVVRPFSVRPRKEIEFDPSKEIDDERDSDIYDTCMAHADIYGTFAEEEEEDKEGIYDVLMSDKSMPPVVEKSTPKSRKDMCINELLCTEKKYLDVLHIIETHFMNPLSSILEQSDFEKIFFKIKELIEIHEGFYSSLCTTTNSSKEDAFQKSVSDCFIMWKEKFLVYGEFCSNLPSAQELIEILFTKPQFKIPIEQCQLDATEGKFMFRDLIPVPMQRVLKYSLLLQEMVRATEPNDTENRMLQRALEEMKDLSLYINEVKRDNETLQLINEIEKNVIGLKIPEDTRLRDYGRLLRDGNLKVKSTSNSKTKLLTVFVFDKVIILCTPKDDMNEYKECLIMSQYLVDDAIHIKDKAFAHGFVLKNKSDLGLCYTFGAKSKELRKEWIEAFQLAQSNINPAQANANGHHFVMTSYDKPTICDVCRKLLRGVFFQGYKCQKTGMSAHKECIPQALNMKGPPTIVRRPSTSAQPTIARVKAIQSFNGSLSATDSELTFEKDTEFDLISDLGKLWIGRIGNRVGCFPKLYVTVVQDFRQDKWHYSDQVKDVVNKHLANARMGRRNTEPSLPSCPPRLLKDPDQYLKIYPWYVGDISRDDASDMLKRCPDGTFLVRQSDKGGFALSVMYNGAQHIKIREIEGQFSLDAITCFASIPDLIEHFKKTSLEACFSELTITLMFAVKDLQMSSLRKADDDAKYCLAIFDYSAMDSNQISFRIDDRITVVSKSSEDQGWWKGRLNGKTGYFPCAYVKEI